MDKKVTLGAIFIYATGRTFTPLERLYIIAGELQTDYGARNSQRLEPYNRLDLSLTWTPKPDSQKIYFQLGVLRV